MSKPLRVVEVRKTFGRTAAVDGVSFEAAAGELFFLLGPSGCGKTTLLRAVAGFAEPDEGRIYLGDREIGRLPPHRRNTAMVFQSYALWPHMTVLENVAFGLQLRGLGRKERQEKAMSSLAWVQMSELAERKPNQLSGGQQQRVALARAMAVDPDCLLLDEPLSNLDAKLRLEMRAEIQRIHRETSLTILYVTHDQKEALSLADRVALMRDGRIEQIGPPREMYHRPATRFAAGFLGEANFFKGRVKAIHPADGGGERPAEVESALGRLVGRAAGDGLAEEADCAVMVRPESLRLERADEGQGDGQVNSSAVRVEHVTFLGEMEQVLVRTEASGQLVKIMEVPRGIVWQAGDRGVVRFEASSASVYGPQERG
jgi:iron(III) transport system ATP-binding protein